MNMIHSPNGQPLTFEQLEQAKQYIIKSLPQLLEQSPEFVALIVRVVAEKFPQREEFARLVEQVEAHRRETQQHKREVDERFDKVDERLDKIDERFDKVDERLDKMDERFDKVDERLDKMDERFDKMDERFDKMDDRFDKMDERFDKMDERFESLELTLARLGSRWGIHSEGIFRKTMKAVLEESFDATVEERHIQGEQFDLVVMKNGDHILIEIAASVRRDVLERFRRKKRLYIAEMGVVPARIILAVGRINSYSAQALRDAGIDVIEPDDDFYGEE